MGKIRFIAALWISKSARLALRILGKNATYFPGYLALRLCPDFLMRIGKPKRIVAVTGTNGKTTVSNLLNDILTSSGRSVLNNGLGSNVAAGIATSLITGSGLLGKTKYETAVFEVDERSAGRIFPHVKPELLVITNLFRDSIMRNAHPEYIAGIIEKNIPAGTKLILNADDLISSAIAPQNPRAYFGIGRMDGDITECINLINDIQICPRCGGKLLYDYRRYHHIGRARCGDCGFESPAYDYAASEVNIGGMSMTVSDKSGAREYALLSDSVFNIYNMVTVVAALTELGLSGDEISTGFEKTKIAESRYNETRESGINVVMQMSKDRNALACSRAFDYISAKPGKKELILMMNNLSDQKKWSENVCWLYDCDFEFFTRGDISRIIVTGPRAKDYYLRLLYAGVPEQSLKCVMREIDAPALLELNTDESVYIFYGTDAIDLAYRVKNETLRRVREVRA